MIMMTENNDFDLYISMGEKNKFVDNNKAFFYFQKAFELDPSNPDSLSNYLIYAIMKDKNLNFRLEIQFETPFFLTSSTTVISGGARMRIRGPHVPVPLLV